MGLPGPQGDSLVEIATFLLRRWSGADGVTVEITDRAGAGTRLADGRVALAGPGRRAGDGFAGYRQFRTALWYEAMRVRHCERILSGDHAFGFVLNAMETRRVEALGRRTWRGMDGEILFADACMLASRPRLDAVHGRARMVEAFYQLFMFGAIKGDLQQSHLERVQRAAAAAAGAVRTAVAEDRGTGWMEERVGAIIRTLDVDSLLTIPVSLPFARAGMALDEAELRRALRIVADSRGAGFGTGGAEAALRGEGVYDEYRTLLDEDRRAQNIGLAPEPVGIQTPQAAGADESAIYDPALISGLKARFREWRSGWREVHAGSGDEFDGEGYVEGHGPFIADVKRSIRTRIVLLLDHSSSIASDALEYKKATLALCEVLSFLRVGFAVYAFSTENRAVVCWSIKPEGAKWNSAAAKRLAQVRANGSTPLAEVYDRMLPVLQARRPDIFLTLTDGEPSDPDAVRAVTKSLRGLGIRMVAMGLGPSTVRATAIAGNLRRLGYDRTVAASRLADVPGRVIGMLEA